jgi:prephenate dehydrogenase
MSDEIVGVIGTGLIGGSIALRARDKGFRTIGYDASRVALEEAATAGVVDEAVTRGALLARADILVIAVPVAGTIGEIATLRESPDIRARLIIDVASVKAAIETASHGLSKFVGTHPMAGAEGSGPSAARSDLFDGRCWLYVPPGDAEVELEVRSFIELMGAAPVAVDAKEHDRVVALTSHLPQMLAFAFARRMKSLGPVAEPMCGPVARELLRLGTSNPRVWDSIFSANEANVAAELRSLLIELSG